MLDGCVVLVEDPILDDIECPVLDDLLRNDDNVMLDEGLILGSCPEVDIAESSENN